jgi:hypothetical protein
MVFPSFTWPSTGLQRWSGLLAALIDIGRSLIVTRGQCADTSPAGSHSTG